MKDTGIKTECKRKKKDKGKRVGNVGGSIEVWDLHLPYMATLGGVCFKPVILILVPYCSGERQLGK